MVAADRAPRSRIIRNPATLVTPWDLTGEPRPSKGLGHGVAGSGDGVASARACFGGGQKVFRFRWGGFGARRHPPPFPGFLQPPRPPELTAVRVGTQHLDTNDGARR